MGDTLLTLSGDVGRYYIEARGYQARIAVAEDTLRSRTDTWHITRAKAQGGTGTGLDAVQAHADAESAAAAIPPLEYDFRQSVNRLAVLTGQPPQSVLDRMRAVRPIPHVGGAIEPDPPVLALARRPDVRAAERRIAAASADIGVAQADRFPAVTLAGSIGINSTTIQSMANASSNVWSFGPTFSVPVFDAGKRRAKVDEKVAVREEKVAAWQATVRGALEETENALVALDRERAHNAALRRTVDAYADALNVSQAQYPGWTGQLPQCAGCRPLAGDRARQPGAERCRPRDRRSRALQGAWRRLGGCRQDVGAMMLPRPDRRTTIQCMS